MKLKKSQSSPKKLQRKPPPKMVFEYEEPKVRASDLQFGGDHYKQMGVQPWDVMDDWPYEQRIGALRLSALKYLMRLGAKDDVRTELEKARHCIDKMLEVVSE